MKKGDFLHCAAIILSAFVLAGCMSIPNSPNPKFYMLTSADKDKVTQKFNAAPGLIVAIGPINIPEYLARPQIVTRDKNGMLHFAQFDRWGEDIDYGFARLIMEDLGIMVSGVNFQIFPCNFAIPLDYQIIINIVKLESELNKDMFLSTQWSVIDSRNKALVLTRISELRNPIEPHSYAGLAKTLSGLCISLSEEIAKEISLLPKPADRKNKDLKSN